MEYYVFSWHTVPVQKMLTGLTSYFYSSYQKFSGHCGPNLAGSLEKTFISSIH
ncbi:hypothetical protein M378DRAFT_729199 [Amanita muscaria Koide BX008]|uniref:Uncharacterized protein n=1 Tax=Amanita muscaria (strain Koide BX008) TaxID=946122 RepID=A0A0C2X347_AMAMK|nr:hypothetical protein M378DRAFT_729199 [Amanita muscaria Koide BX008]